MQETAAARAAQALLDRRAGVPGDLRDLGYVELTPALLAWGRRMLPELVARWRAAGGGYAAAYDLGLDRLTRALFDEAFEVCTDDELLELWTSEVYCRTCGTCTRWDLADGYCIACGRSAAGEPIGPTLAELEESLAVACEEATGGQPGR